MSDDTRSNGVRSNRQSEREGDGSTDLSRRAALSVVGAAGLLSLNSMSAAAVSEHGEDGQGDQDGFMIIKNPMFLVDKDGEPLGEDHRPETERDTLLFDPGPEGPPLEELVELGVESYDEEVEGETVELDSTLFRSLMDSRRLATKPPNGWDGGEYEESWPALTWNDYRTVEADAHLDVTPNCTNVEVEIDGAIPNGKYTIWVVKFEDGEMVGFQPLGANQGGENIVRMDGDGHGTLAASNKGGTLTGVPGFGDPPEGAEIAKNLTEEEEIHLVGAYHYDDQTWEINPGPYHLNHFALVFDF